MTRMSFDDYANHIYQKHCLAVALAILKSKPTNVKTDDYLEELKSKIDHKMDDDEITVCSEDFLMEDNDDDDELNNSMTILKDFDPNFVNNEENSLGDDNAISKKPPTKPEIIRNIPENLSQITYYEGSPQTQYNSDNIGSETTNTLISQNEDNINQKLDVEESIPKNVILHESNDKIRNIDQNTDIGQKSDVTYYDSQKTLLYTVHGFTQNYTHYSPSQPDIVIPNKYLYNSNKNTNSNVQNKDNNTVTANIQDFDSKTQTDKTRNSLNVEKPTNKDEFEYIRTMNMFSQTNDENFDVIQNDIRLTKSERHETMNDINIIINKETENNKNQFSQNSKEYFEDNDMTNSFPIGNKVKNADQNPKITKNSEMNNVPFGNNSKNIDYLLQNTEFSQNNAKEIDENRKITHNMETNDEIFGYNSQNIDYLSQNTEFNQNNAKKADQILKITDNTKVNDVPFGYGQNIGYLSQSTEFSQNYAKKAGDIPNKTVDMGVNEVSFGYNSQNIDYLPQSTEFSQNNINNAYQTPKITDNMETNDIPFEYSHNIDYLSQNECSHSQNDFDKVTKANDKTQFHNDMNTENLTQNTEKHNQLATFTSVNDSSHKHRREEDDEFESEEIISYKVLEEFNKVQSFLKRQNRRMSCDGYSTDSGYRSDSQRSSNRSALQLSGNWLNQSGCCLFNYIMQCHLVATTRDITNEIAQVLSQLIDRLHEEEKYPSFLEDLLGTVDLLLQKIYEGDSSEDGELLKKDENIQRILLLNKSIHIQKHTLEKITNILQTFHFKVTEIDSTFELSNIDQVENITYIFHILEILLKRYLKNREVHSQVSTQNSQDDEKVFKKSSITDIWRKKWNPSQKVFEGSREKKCVLKNCSEILNKIVVDCVSSYSLIAYSALKCFNSMQT